MLRACTTSTDTTLLSLSAYKVAIGTTSTADDAALQSALERATSLVEGYLGYPLRRQVYLETVPAGGSNQLQVSRTPLRAIESIRYGADLVDPTSYDIESEGAGLIYRPLGWPWSAGVSWDLDPHIVPNSESKDFTVVYEAGYCTNGSTDAGWLTTGEAVPSEVEAALLISTTYLHKNANRDPSVSSKRIGDLSISYQGGGSAFGASGTPSVGLPDSVKGMLSHLRKF